MSDLLVRVSGRCGRITLNRPRALNALSTEMVCAMHTALAAWASDPRVALVLLDGAGERGLCAGGDIRAVYEAVRSGNPNAAVAFFRTEYRLNYLIARYPKPFVAIMDGLVMGGGIGVSGHASHRVVTERSELAMPETAIGFVPDVGGTHLLRNAPAEFGTYLGLTGSRIGAPDAIACGLADFLVPSEELQASIKQLETCETPDMLEDALRGRASDRSPGKLAAQGSWIRESFSAHTVEEIFAALAQHLSPEAGVALGELRTKSPTSLKVTLAALRNARKWNNLALCLEQEFRIAQVCLRKDDFMEGIRAAIIDKDRRPCWHPERLEEVTSQEVERYFTTPGLGSLCLAEPS